MTRGRADAPHWSAVLALAPPALAPGGPAGDGGNVRSDGDVVVDGNADPVRAWNGLVRGEAEALEPRMADLFAFAAAARDPRLVVEMTALRALVLASLGKAGEALVFARRASLMARTEADPDAELLANLVLARMRRHAGKPHLAMRILDAIARLVPDAPRAWLEWERLLASGASPDGPLGEAGDGDAQATPATTPPSASSTVAAQTGRRLLLAARAGARADFERLAAELLAATAGWRDVQDEARALVELLDPDRAVSDGAAQLPQRRRGGDALRPVWRARRPG